MYTIVTILKLIVMIAYISYFFANLQANELVHDLCLSYYPPMNPGS